MACTPQKWTLKIDFEGDVRRLRGWPDNEAVPTMESLQSAIALLFDLNLAQQDQLSLKYIDEEGDLCTLVEPTLKDALQIAADLGVLRLNAVCKEAGDATSRVPQPPESGPLAAEPIPQTEAVEAVLQSEARIQLEEHLASVKSVEHGAIESVAAPAHSLHDLAEIVRHSVSERVSQAGRFAKDGLDNANIARQNISEQLSETGCNVSDQLSETRHSVSGQLSEAGRITRERLRDARPHVSSGVTYFTEQVKDDFKSTSKDMKEAFGPEGSRGRNFGKVCAVAGAAAGVIAVTRLAPVRAARLAALSVAAVAGAAGAVSSGAGTDDEQTRPGDAPQTASHDAPQLQEGHASGSVAHFKQQVNNDFESIRNDVSTAFNCILGQAGSTPSTTSTNSSTQQPSDLTEQLAAGQPQEQQTQNTLKATIPAVASTMVGVGVTAFLMPLRLARLSVASLANAAASQDQAADDEVTQGSEERSAHTSQQSSEQPEVGNQ